MANLEVANTILQQLGGKRFIAFTGAKNFVGSATALSFRLPNNGILGINAVRIELMPSDTYTVTFGRFSTRGFVVKARLEDIYCDQLQDVFTRHTGLDTHF